MRQKNPSGTKKVPFLCIVLLISGFICLLVNCKKQATNPDIPSSQNENKLSVSCSPSSGGTGTVLDVTIFCAGNSKELKTFGLEMTYDPAIFQYESTRKGGLTGSWASVDGNEISSGKLIIGGFTGSGNPVVAGSNGSLVIIKIKVIYSGNESGFTRQISINKYLDDIVGMSPMPTSTTFTFIK